MKATLILLITLLMSFTLSQSIDTYPGLFELRVNEPFAPVKYLFEPTLEKDSSGKLYHVLRNPSASEYYDILGGDVARLLVNENNGVIDEVVVIYTKEGSLTKITDEAVKMYGGTGCMLAVENHEIGGCFWDGEKYFLHITREEDRPYVEARFGRIQK